MKCSLGIANFLEEISSLSQSVLFLYFFALITEEGFLISSCYSLEFCIQMLTSFLLSFAFHSLLFTAIFKASPDRHFAFLHFFFLGHGLDSCLLYNFTNLCSCPYFIRHSIRFKGLDLIECWMNYVRRFVTLYRRQGSRPSPWKRNAKKQNACLGRP